MKDPILYKSMTGLDPINFKLPTHEINTFVDDTFNTIAFEPNSKIKTYLEKYFALLNSYFNSNMLKVNPQKTGLMFVSKHKYRLITKFLSFKAGNFEIK